MPEPVESLGVKSRIRNADLMARVTLSEIIPLLRKIPESRLQEVKEFLDKALEEAQRKSPSTSIRAVNPLIRGANP